VAVFAYEYLFPGSAFQDPELPISPLTLYGPSVRAGEWWRVLSANVEHGGPLHLFFNMSVVWTMGRAYEAGIGTWRFAQISLVSALGSSVAVLFFAFGSPTVGASGMILGWVGAILPIASRTARRQLGVWLLQIVVISILPGVSWQAHLGGFVAGMLCGLALRAGAKVFRYAMPVLAFVMAVLTVVAAHR
jgi:membrane associated rhomboid family serine protease